jgi:2-desacetyl-2-hydroxyethyl bacteriochlorophyllide A dehydrogenase
MNDVDTMQAVLITGRDALQQGCLPIPAVKPGHILIETAFVGICGTDVHLLEGDSFYLEHHYLKYPFVFGHEYSGRVVALSEDVDTLQIGDRVVGHCMVPCHSCDMCRRGKRHLCRNLKEVGLRYIQGAAADYVSVPAYAITKVPPSLSLKAATLVEPAVTVYHATERANIRPDDHVAVIGTGTIGLLAMLMAKLTASSVDVIGIEESELQFAKTLGADQTLRPSEAESDKYSVVLEASGAAVSTGLTARILDLGGRASLIGVVNQPAREFVPSLVTLKDLTFHGILHGLDYYEQTVELFASGRLDPLQLVERTGSIEETGALFREMKSAQRRRPKYLLEFAGESRAS